jgi:HEAT repeat protein
MFLGAGTAPEEPAAAEGEGGELQPAAEAEPAAEGDADGSESAGCVGLKRTASDGEMLRLFQTLQHAESEQVRGAAATALGLESADDDTLVVDKAQLAKLLQGLAVKGEEGAAAALVDTDEAALLAAQVCLDELGKATVTASGGVTLGLLVGLAARNVVAL